MISLALRQFYFSAAIFLATFYPATRSQAQQLLTKLDFESSASSLKNWTLGYQDQYKGVNGWKDAFLITVDEENPHSGQGCLQFEALQSQPGAKNLVAPAVAITLPGDQTPQNIRVRLFARAKGFDDGEVEVRVLEADAHHAILGWAGGKKTLIPIQSGDGWQEFEGEGILNPKTAWITLMLVVGSDKASGVVAFDDITVEMAPAN